MGVEGINDNILAECINKASTHIDERKCHITKADFVRLGLAGGKGSREKREKLLKIMDLPAGISTNALVQIINSVYNSKETENFLKQIIN